jgi:hypothetical protein
MEPAWGRRRSGGSLIGMQTTLIHIALAKANARGRR